MGASASKGAHEGVGYTEGVVVQPPKVGRVRDMVQKHRRVLSMTRGPIVLRPKGTPESQSKDEPEDNSDSDKSKKEEMVEEFERFRQMKQDIEVQHVEYLKRLEKKNTRGTTKKKKR